MRPQINTAQTRSVSWPYNRRWPSRRSDIPVRTLSRRRQALQGLRQRLEYALRLSLCLPPSLTSVLLTPHASLLAVFMEMCSTAATDVPAQLLVIIHYPAPSPALDNVPCKWHSGQHCFLSGIPPFGTGNPYKPTHTFSSSCFSGATSFMNLSRSNRFCLNFSPLHPWPLKMGSVAGSKSINRLTSGVICGAKRQVFALCVKRARDAKAFPKIRRRAIPEKCELADWSQSRMEEALGLSWESMPWVVTRGERNTVFSELWGRSSVWLELCMAQICGGVHCAPGSRHGPKLWTCVQAGDTSPAPFPVLAAHSNKDMIH